MEFMNIMKFKLRAKRFNAAHY